jgi:hypothetical protein
MLKRIKSASSAGFTSSRTATSSGFKRSPSKLLSSLGNLLLFEGLGEGLVFDGPETLAVE